MSIGYTDIGNLALNHVGEPPILNANDQDNDLARVIDLVFEPAIREMGRDHEWNCLKTRTELTQDAQPPAFGWAYSYTLPPQCIRVLRINGAVVDQPYDLFEVEGRKILTNAETVKLQYIEFTDDTTKYDSLFVESLALLVASKIANQIRQDEGLAARKYEEYKVSLANARKVDGNERKVQPYDGRNESSSIQARRSGTFNGIVLNT